MHKYMVYFCQNYKWRGKRETVNQCRLARDLKIVWILPRIQTVLDQGGTTFRKRSQGNLHSSTYRYQKSRGKNLQHQRDAKWDTATLFLCS